MDSESKGVGLKDGSKGGFHPTNSKVNVEISETFNGFRCWLVESNTKIRLAEHFITHNVELRFG